MLAALSVVDEGQDRVEVRGGAAVVRKEVEVKLGCNYFLSDSN